MKIPALIFTILFLGSTGSAMAHRLDEYFQAATIAVARDRITVQLRLNPGIEVAHQLLPEIDADGDGVISAEDQRAYTQHAVEDLALSIDGEIIPLQVFSTNFPQASAIAGGSGNILLTLQAAPVLPSGQHRLVLENRHLSAMAVYSVNALVPRDPAIQILGQERNADQSFYQLNYRITGDQSRAQTESAASGQSATDNSGGIPPAIKAQIITALALLVLATFTVSTCPGNAARQRQSTVIRFRRHKSFVNFFEA